MPRPILQKALLWSAFCVLGSHIKLATADTDCALDKASESVTVAKVYDADTVLLKDGRILRFIGINTPELEHNERAAEPYAENASHFVRKLIKQSRTLYLRLDEEKYDHYHRLLAHVFLHDKRNLGALLLVKGYARVLRVPPNQWQAACYQRLERLARQTKTGIWSHQYFQAIAVNKLKTAAINNYSYQFVSGKVTRIGHSKKNLWINLGNSFAARINKASLHYFKGFDFQALVGKVIMVRGYIAYYPKKKSYRMLLRHPSSLEIKAPSRSG